MGVNSYCFRLAPRGCDHVTEGVVLRALGSTRKTISINRAEDDFCKPKAAYHR